MNTKYLFVICPSYLGMLKNFALTKECENNYIGSGWIYLLKERLVADGHMVMTSDFALDELKKNKNNKEQRIYLISEGRAIGSRELVRHGAKKLIYVNQENPVYDPYSYEHQNVDGYKFTYLYKSLHNENYQTENLREFILPGQVASEAQVNWQERISRCVIVSSNKFHPSGLLYYPRKIIPKTIKKIIRHYYEYCRYSLYRKNLSELTYRTKYELIEGLAQKGIIDIYGKGWNNYSEFPRSFNIDLNSIVKRWFGPVDNKIKTISKYKYCLVVENTFLPGIITEKIFDGLSAGCIIFYIGARDISTKFNVANIHILNHYSSQEAISYIESMVNSECCDDARTKEPVISRQSIKKVLTTSIEFAESLYECINET